MFEPKTGIAGGKMPIGFEVVGGAILFPSGDFVGENLHGWNGRPTNCDARTASSRKAMSRQLLCLGVPCLGGHYNAIRTVRPDAELRRRGKPHPAGGLTRVERRAPDAPGRAESYSEPERSF